MVRRRILICSLVVAACSGKRSTPAAGSGSGSAPAPPPPVAAPVKPHPEVDRAAYRAGMRTGRKATDAKRYAEAVTAFDAALVAKPGDPRALGERGFAKLLEGSDLDGATRDLDLAASGTKDTKMLSMIWFNRGLVAEKRGDNFNAAAAFMIANQLRPTAAAQAKLAGKAGCPVTVDRFREIPMHAAVEAADWLALARALPHEDDAALATTEDAWALLEGERTAPKLPTTAEAGDWSEHVVYLVVKAGPGLRAVPLGSASGGRCPGSVQFDVEQVDATRIRVSGTEMYEGGYTFMCEGKDGDPVECTGADNEVSAGTACLGGTPSRFDRRARSGRERPRGVRAARRGQPRDGDAGSGRGEARGARV